MADHVALIETLSNITIQVMANWQMPPLREGKILLGREFVDASSAAPPRIVFVPVRGRFLNPSQVTSPNGVPDPNRIRARPLWTEATDFEVHIWGWDPSRPQVKHAHIRATQQLVRALLVSAWYGGPTGLQPVSFEWPSQVEGAIVREGLGEYLVMNLTAFAPIVDISVNFAPQGVRLNPAIAISLSSPK